MAKKKKRYGKKPLKKQPVRSSSARDVHHIWFIAREYSGKYTSQLRNFWYCKMSIPRDTLHREIHRNVARVPLPKDSSAREAIAILKDLDKRGALKETHSILTRLQLLICIFEYVEPDTTLALKAQYEVVEKFYAHNKGD